MTSGCDEVKKGVNSIVAEAGITLDSGLFGENGIVLSLEVAHDLAKRRLVVDLVAKAGSVDDGQRDSGTFLVNLKLYS